MNETAALHFFGSTGATLAGVLHRPAERARGSILLAHCFTCSKDVHTLARLARGLSDAGYAVLRFDLTGLGDSGGVFSTTTLSHNVRDLSAAATALIEQGFGPCGLLGHSLGGAASLLAASKLKTVRSVVVLGAPAFLDDLGTHDAADRTGSLGRPLLVVHAVDDEVVRIDQGERIFATARQPKGFYPPLRGDHLVTDREVAEELLGVVRSWFDRTLGAGSG